MRRRGAVCRRVGPPTCRSPGQTPTHAHVLRPTAGPARALSRLGICSRSQAWTLIRAGRVRLNGVVERDGERRVRLGNDRIEVDAEAVRAQERVYLMLNKPRGLVTTASDERGRDTVFACFQDASLPQLVPAGRLDKASEGLLLMTNDTAWAARLTDPASHIDKTYHVQIDCLADAALVARLHDGVESDGERLAVKRASVLRLGGKNSWLEIVLDEGRNRHIRRLLEALGIQVLRLVRVAVGSLPLGNLAKGAQRVLTPQEIESLAGGQSMHAHGRQPHAHAGRA